MWIINGDLLYSVPDDVPVPRGAKRVELPEGFHEDPARWHVRGGAVVEHKPTKPRAPSGLTADDIKALKAAIAAGKL